MTEQARDAIDNQERIKEQVSHTLFMLSTMSGMPIDQVKLGGSHNFTLEELADDLMSVGVAIQLGYDQDFTSTKDGVDLDDLRSQLAALTTERDELKKQNEGMLEVGGFDYMAQQVKDAEQDAAKHRNATKLLVEERKQITAQRDQALADLEVERGKAERLRAMLDHPLILKVLGDLEDGAGTHELWSHARSWMDVRDELLKETTDAE